MGLLDALNSNNIVCFSVSVMFFCFKEHKTFLLTEDNTIKSEFDKVGHTLTSSSQYEDMKTYADTCKAWLNALVSMGPPGSLSLLKHDLFKPENVDDADEPLSPSSRELRNKVTEKLQNRICFHVRVCLCIDDYNVS